ncbi:GntR family transcriptional regulator [Pseudothermotoga sp.]|uniref:GntR family transcriptional regulator n=1 Tax=Pseudothermotoga sp. TaxID=2033661 RepID=UPI000E8EB380|nr:GntR family transcriptional regulator [Pseudothermotoga sp.]HBJ81214.1 GntR family transcriptional regulator [Pseudothermotoga sp.]
MIDRTNAMPLYVQLKQELKEKILKGDWKEGEKIPAEFDLMKIYKVSRATVRSAIDSLVLEGYLVKKHGIGTFVKRIRPSLGFEPLISLSYALETFNIHSKNTVLEKKYIDIDRKLKQKLRFKYAAKCLYVRRLRYVDEVPVAIEDSYFHPKTAHVFDGKDLSKSIAKILVNETDVSISKVEQIIIPRVAEKEERALLVLSEETQILHMQRWIYVQNQVEPIYYLNLIMRNDLSTFHIAR